MVPVDVLERHPARVSDPPVDLYRPVGRVAHQAVGPVVAHRDPVGYRGSVLLPAARFDRAQAVFLKYGHWAVFVARFITGLRVLAGPFAGAFLMEYRRFLFFNFSGAVLWAITIGCVGYFFGGNWGRLLGLLKEFDLITLAVLLVTVGIVIYRSRRKA